MDLQNYQAVEVEGGKLIKMPTDGHQARYLINGEACLPRTIMIRDCDSVTRREKIPVNNYYINDKDQQVSILEFNTTRKAIKDRYKVNGEYPNLDEEYKAKKEIQDYEKSLTYTVAEPKWSKPEDITDKFKVVGCVVDTGSSFITCNIRINRQTPNLFTVHLNSVRRAVIEKYRGMNLTKKNWDVESVRFAKIGKDYINTTEQKFAYSATLEEAQRIVRATAKECENRILDILTPSTLDKSQRVLVRNRLESIKNRVQSLDVKKSSHDDQRYAIGFISSVIQEVDELELGFEKPDSIVEEVINEAA